MKNLITTAAAIAVSAAMSLTAAHAAVVDFALEADTNGERGLADGDMLTLGGVQMIFAAGVEMNGVLSPDANVYLDAGQAGLGVCSTGLTAAAQCVVPSDDNLADREMAGIGFLNGTFNLSNFVFRGSNHAILGDDAMITLSVAQNGLLDTRTLSIGALAALSAMNDAFLMNAEGILLGFAGTPFYLSSFEATPTPIPAAGLLFGTALAGAGFMRRKRPA